MTEFQQHNMNMMRGDGGGDAKRQRLGSGMAPYSGMPSMYPPPQYVLPYTPPAYGGYGGGAGYDAQGAYGHGAQGAYGHGAPGAPYGTPYSHYDPNMNPYPSSDPNQPYGGLMQPPRP